MAVQPIDSILPQEPEVSLLTSAHKFPANEAAFDRWRTGVSARDLGCLSATSEAGVCPEAGDRFTPTTLGLHEFFPLVTYLPHGCDGFVDDPPRWVEEAKASLRARVPYTIARELWTGAESGSASLQSTAILSSDTGLTPVAGIASALADFEECTQGGMTPFIHAPSSVIGSLSVNGYFERKGARLLTATGAVVVPGPGYPNSVGAWGPLTDPEDLESGAESAEGQVWVYVTGPVQIPDLVFPDSPVDEWWNRGNSFETAPRVWSIARFDTCCVFAALVTVPDAEV